MTTDPLSKLPMFATDDEIAIAIVGKARASNWKRGALLILEARGFPRVDALHGGRPVPLVRKWYNQYLGVDRGYVQTTQEGGKENPEAWRPKRLRRNDRKPQMGLDGRSQKILLYMVGHPDCQTHVEIPEAGAFGMDRLAEKGVVAPAGRDKNGGQKWKVTDLGLEEAKRIEFWHYGKSDGPR